jgi:hypothetical protein
MMRERGQPDLSHVNEIIDSVLRGVQIDNKHDIPSGANSEKRTVYVDKRIPQYDRNLLLPSGQPFDIYHALAVHEMSEERVMQKGMSYDKAHNTIATPLERHFVEQQGVKWHEYSKVIDGYLKETEKEKGKLDIPAGLHEDPEAADQHHRGKDDDGTGGGDDTVPLDVGKIENVLGPIAPAGAYDPLAASAGIAPVSTPRIDQLLSPQNSWLQRAAEQMNRDRAAYAHGGVRALLRDTSETQELAQGFGGSALGTTENALLGGASKAMREYYGTGDRLAKEMKDIVAALPEGHPAKAAPSADAQLARVAKSGEDVPNVVVSKHLVNDPNYPGGVIQMPSGDLATASHVHNINDPYYWKEYGPGGHGFPSPGTQKFAPLASASHEALPSLPVKPASAPYKLVPTADFDPEQQDYFIHSPSGEEVGQLTHQPAPRDTSTLEPDTWHLSIPQMGDAKPYKATVESPNSGLRIAQLNHQTATTTAFTPTQVMAGLPQSTLKLPKLPALNDTAYFNDLGPFPREMPFGVPAHARALDFETPGIHGTGRNTYSWSIPGPSGAPTGVKGMEALSAAHAKGVDALKLPENELGVHFGNPRQATRFSGKEVGFWNLPRSYPTVLRTGNQLELPDLGSWGLSNVRGALQRINNGTLEGFAPGDLEGPLRTISPEHKGLFPDEELSKLKGIPDVRNYLASKGFDSIKYVNSVEDPGAYSHIMFKPSPVAPEFVAGVRSPFAKFAPHKLGYPELAAGIGAGMIAPGLFIDEDGKPLVRTK